MEDFIKLEDPILIEEAEKLSRETLNYLHNTNIVVKLQENEDSEVETVYEGNMLGFLDINQFDEEILELFLGLKAVGTEVLPEISGTWYFTRVK